MRQGAQAEYLLCNADESEPGTFKDRLLIEKDPHLLLEGCLISAYAMGAARCFIYIRGEYVHGARVLEKAIAEATAKGYAGTNVLGKGWSCELTLHVGAGAYICGRRPSLSRSRAARIPRLKPRSPRSTAPSDADDDQQRRDPRERPFIVGAARPGCFGRAQKNTGPSSTACRAM
jgi:NADH-quinone oxidoreductase subunit F